MSAEHEKEMSLLGHIGELRKHLIRIVIYVAVAAIAVFVYIEEFTTKVVLAPSQNDFLSIKWLNEFFQNIGLKNTKFEYTGNYIIQQRELSEGFNLSIQIALVAGIVVAFPLIIWEIWRFVSPGLKPSEKKNSSLYIIATVLLFFIGALFGYFIISPIAIQFFINYNLSQIIQKQIDISSIIKMILSSTIGMAIVFLFPIITYALTSMELLTPSFLKTYRKHSYVVILIIAAFITPADFISMFVAAIPLWILFEMSVGVSIMVDKRNRKKHLSL